MNPKIVEKIGAGLERRFAAITLVGNSRINIAPHFLEEGIEPWPR
jgi:hypothetical protein